jgi:PTH1 family peptidyl-tRNA hydrolase
MNLSGQSVQAAAQFHKIAPEQIIVFHDELDLPPGRVRIKRGGGSGGHNGIKSLDQHLGPDYWRVRIGIGHPGDKSLVNPWVLGDFSAADQHWLAPLLGALAGHLPLLLQGEHNDYLARVSAALPAAADGED